MLVFIVISDSVYPFFVPCQFYSLRINPLINAVGAASYGDTTDPNTSEY